jgi:hypothetical protein
MATLDIICGLDEVDLGANILDAAHAYLLEVVLNIPSSSSTYNWSFDSVHSKYRSAKKYGSSGGWSVQRTPNVTKCWIVAVKGLLSQNTEVPG